MAETGRRRRGRAAPAVRRGPLLAGFAALLVAGGVADRGSGPPVAAGVPAADAVPTAAPAAALSSAFFCAGAGPAGSSTAGALVLADAGPRPERATVRLVGSGGQRASTTVEVPARGSTVVPEALPGGPAATAAVVDVDGGSAAATQAVTGPGGWSATPCATAGSASWYLTGGATLVNASDVVTLLNPYPTDAVVDLRFTTDQGVEEPGDFQGVIVPAGGVVPVNLGSHLRRRRAVATTVHARSGRVVAYQTEVVAPPAAGQAVLGAPAPPTATGAADPASPVPGVTLTLGAPATGATWAWPAGQAGGGVDERYTVYNPGSVTAEVSLSVALDQGQAEPFQLEVGPRSTTVVDAGGQARIPPGVGHSAVLRVVAGPGVVAGRSTSGAASSPLPGIAALPGLGAPAAAWLLPTTGAPGSTTLAVLPTGPDPLEVSVDALSGGREVAVPGLAHVTLAPGSRAVLPVSAKLPSLGGPLVVRATGPVYVEEDLVGAGGVPGTVAMPAVRLP